MKSMSQCEFIKSKLVIALAVMFSLPLSALAGEVPWKNEREHPPVISLEAVGQGSVEVHFGSTKYSIPQNYLAGFTRATDRSNYASITIEVVLPDLSPRSNANISQFDALDWHEQVRTLFEYPRRPRDPQQLLGYYLHVFGKTADQFTMTGNNYKRYTSDARGNPEVFVKNRQSGLLVAVCDGELAAVPSPSCTINEPFSDDVGVIYHFGKQHLNDAGEIDDRLQELMNKFQAN